MSKGSRYQSVNDYKPGSIFLDRIEKKDIINEDGAKAGTRTTLLTKTNQGGMVKTPCYEVPYDLVLPNGLKFDSNNRVSTFVSFGDNPSVEDMIAFPDSNVKTGYVLLNEVDVLGVNSEGKTTASVKGESKINLHDSPDGNIKDTLDPSDEIIITGKSSDGSYLKIEKPGVGGSLYQIVVDCCKVIFENKLKCGLAKLKTLEDVIRLVHFDSIVYVPLTKTGEINREKNKSAYWDVSNYKTATEHNYAKFYPPCVGEDPPMLEKLQNIQITGKPVINFGRRVSIAPTKIKFQFKIVSFAIKDLKPKEDINYQAATIAEYAKDKEAAKKTLEVLEKLRNVEIEAQVEDKQHDVNDLIPSGGGVSEDVSKEEFPEVEGLEDL